MRRFVVSLIAAVLVVSVAPPAEVASAAPLATTETVTLRADSTVTVAGRGYGHGRGLSQWGARAAAASGVGYREILDFYYPGTRSTTQAASTISVLLSGDDDNDLRVVAAPGMTVSDAKNSNVSIGFPDATPTQWRVVRTSEGLWLEGLVGQTWRRWSQGASPGFLSFSTPTAVVRLVLPDGRQKDYRGSLRAVPDGSAPSQRSVNVVALEDYLRSVVPSESPSGWPADALAAQAVAARTYASHQRAAATGSWQTCDSTQCQVYAGYRSYDASGRLTTTHEAASTDAAVARTAGEVRHYGNALAFTQFSASNGGWTAAGNFPYLTSRADRWDGVGNPSHRWSTTLRSATLQAKYPKIGSPTRIVVRARTGDGEWGGRVTQVVLQGRAGSVTLTGAQFRTAFSLRSDWWKITGTTRLESDTTSDGPADLLAQTADGRLVAYRGNGTGGFAGTSAQGQGWSGMRLALRANDLDGDGTGDLLAMDSAGALWRYSGVASGGFAARSPIGPGWQSMRQLVTPGDLGGDGKGDLLAVDTQGRLWLYTGRGDGTFDIAKQVGFGWQSMPTIVGAGDWNLDGTADLLAIDASGRLLLYPGTGNHAFGAASVIGNGWSGMRLVQPTSDFDGDGLPDLVAADAAGYLYLYPWSGTAFGARRLIGNGWGSITRLL